MDQSASKAFDDIKERMTQADKRKNDTSTYFVTSRFLKVLGVVMPQGQE